MDLSGDSSNALFTTRADGTIVDDDQNEVIESASKEEWQSMSGHLSSERVIPCQGRSGLPARPARHAVHSLRRRPRRAVEFHYTQTDSFVALLQQLGASLLVSTYQANKLLVARAAGAGLSMLVRTFDRPMGLAVDDGRLAIGTRKEVWFLRNAPDIAPRIEPAGRHDACFLPRSCHVTGRHRHSRDRLGRR